MKKWRACSNAMPTALPVPVLEGPHWRVDLRPEGYEAELIPSLASCFQVIEQTKVRLRGWDYPHLSNDPTKRGTGVNWVASWSDFMQHTEYWRFYQSGQFLHLFRVRESTPEWRSELEQITRRHLSHLRQIDWSQVPGFISIENFLYSISEIFEFAARLCQRALYPGRITVRIDLKGVRGYVLTTDWNRAWMNYYAASEDSLGRAWELGSEIVVADSAGQALSAALWFLERFGWLNPSAEILRRDQENFLRGRL